MVVLTLPEQEKEQFRKLLPAIVGFVRQNNSIQRDDLISQIVTLSGISSQTADEWLNKAINSLYDDGVLVRPDYELLLYHFSAIPDEKIPILAEKVIAYAEEHPLTYMVERERARLQEELAFWESQPDMLPNEEKIVEVERIKEDLSRLE